MADIEIPFSLRPVELPRRTITLLVVGVVVAIAGGLAIDVFATGFVDDYSMTAAVVAGTMTVPVSLLLAVYLIDYSRARSRAAVWMEFWGPVQAHRLDEGRYSLILADQLLESRTKPSIGDELVEMTKVRAWLPTIRVGVESGLFRLGRYAEAAERVDLFTALERLHTDHERFQSLVNKFAADVDAARLRGDGEDGSTDFVVSPLDPRVRLSDHGVALHEIGALRTFIGDVIDLCDDIAGQPRRPGRPAVTTT